MTSWEFGNPPKTLKRKVWELTNSIEPVETSYHYSYPGERARYLIDVTVWILRSIARESGLVDENQLDYAISPFVHYVATVFRNSKVSYAVLFTALLYLLRFRNYLSSIPRPNANTIILPALPVVFVTGLVVANKFLHDQHSSNATWMVHSGISLIDLNRGEMFLLQALDHRLFVEPGPFQRWVALLFQPRGNLFTPSSTASSTLSSTLQSTIMTKPVSNSSNSHNDNYSRSHRRKVCDSCLNEEAQPQINLNTQRYSLMRWSKQAAATFQPA